MYLDAPHSLEFHRPLRNNAWLLEFKTTPNHFFLRGASTTCTGGDTAVTASAHIDGALVVY